MSAQYLPSRKNALLSACVLCLAVRSPANACSCAQESVTDRFQQADAVFVGEVTQVGPVVLGERWVNLNVTTAWKGITGREVTVATFADEAACGVEVVPGDLLLVYAAQADSRLYMTLCRAVRDAATIQAEQAEIEQLNVIPPTLADGPDSQWPAQEIVASPCGAGLLPFALLALTLCGVARMRKHS